MNWRRSYRTWSPFSAGAQSINIYSSAMETTGHKVFNDSVHGHITLHPLLVKVVDTPEFQRLRNIKQLGVAYFVYPGAGHCRFEHSLGTCYLARLMVEKLMSRATQIGWQRSEDDKEKLSLCVQLAALCHDLGHGPFSHTWEGVVHQWGFKWMHEESSIQMFDHLVKKNNLVDEFNENGLEKKHLEIIKELIMGGPDSVQKRQLEKQDSFLYEIVSNKKTGIDVDKWDYFLRDGHHLNLRITFDYHRLLELCTVLQTPEGLTYVAFREKEVMNLYDMYRVRSTLHHTAYRHKVVLNIELMLIEAFKAAGDAGYKPNNSRYFLKEAHKTPESMAVMTDHIFYDILYSSDESFSKARKLFERVLKRDLFKFVQKVNVQLPQGLNKTARKNFIQDKKKSLETQLKRDCPSLEFSLGEFFLDLDSENDPVSQASFYRKKPESNEIEEVDFVNIQTDLEPFPFQLTKGTTFSLLVFCKNENVTAAQLVEPKRVIADFEKKSRL